MATYFKVERICDECGAPFWGTRRARFGSAKCRRRAFRKKLFAVSTDQRTELAAAMSEVVARVAASQPYAKLLPRAFRMMAAELRRRGTDPLELLYIWHDDPVSEHDEAPGGIEVAGAIRRKWLYSPEAELRLLDAEIAQRAANSHASPWHIARRDRLRALLATQLGEAATPAGVL